MKLKGKVALVTGFGSGLGRAIGVLYAAEGAAVMGTSTTESKGRETLEMIQKTGGKASFRAGDVGNMDQMRAVVEEAVKNFGGIDILVNSAGVRSNGSVTDMSEQDWDRTLDTNLKGAFVTSHLVVPLMAKRGGGVIINIGARSGITGQAGRAAYA
ncbi:MAG: SDR family NAD(P)-dependent oxidoreductase, partial [Candidatus Binatia bacterium]